MSYLARRFDQPSYGGYKNSTARTQDTSVRRGSREETRSSSTRPTSTTDSSLGRRNRVSGTSDDRNELDGGRKAGRNKENEEAELPAWKRRLQEREKEKREKEEKEQEREREKQRGKELEKEKEKESEMPSYRRSRLLEREKEKEKEKEEKEKEDDDSSVSAATRARRRRLREKRRGGSDEEDTEDVKDSKKNTKLNEENDEKAAAGSRRRSQETRHEDTKSTTDRIRSGRGSDSKGPFGTSKTNATTITETDPQKLKERLQEAQLELQEYKIKLEKAIQAKEELERRYANVEDDIKQLSDLKADNQRLKDENGALIRVISKLSRPPT